MMFMDLGGIRKMRIHESHADTAAWLQFLQLSPQCIPLISQLPGIAIYTGGKI